MATRRAAFFVALGLTLALPASAQAIANDIKYNAGAPSYTGPVGTKALTVTVSGSNLVVRETGSAGLVSSDTGPCTSGSSTFTCPLAAVTGALSFDLGAFDDKLTVDPSVTHRIVAGGNTGNDTIVTGSGPDALNGGSSGNDSLTGGAGVDSFDGQDGDDTINSRDGNIENVACGPGTDRAIRDLGDILSDCDLTSPVAGAVPSVEGDAAVGQRLHANGAAWSGSPVVASQSLRWQSCEADGSACVDIAGAGGDQYVVAPSDAGHRLRAVSTADNGIGGPVESASEPTASIASVPTGPGDPIPPAADTRAPVFSFSVPRVKLGKALSKGVPFSVTADESGNGSADLLLAARTAKKYGLKVPRGAKQVVVGHADFTAVAGQTAKGTAKFSRTARKKLKRARSLKAVLSVTVTDAAGNKSPAATKTLSLKP